LLVRIANSPTIALLGESECGRGDDDRREGIVCVRERECVCMEGGGDFACWRRLLPFEWVMIELVSYQKK
jgi:hypothetical protein